MKLCNPKIIQPQDCERFIFSIYHVSMVYKIKTCVGVYFADNLNKVNPVTLKLGNNHWNVFETSYAIKTHTYTRSWNGYTELL